MTFYDFTSCDFFPWLFLWLYFLHSPSMCHCSRIPMTLILALGSIILALGSMILALGSMILTLGSMILALGSMILALGLCQGMSTFINVYLQSNTKAPRHWSAIGEWSSSGQCTELSIKRTVFRFRLPPFQNLGNFVHPTLPVYFRRDSKSRWSLLPGVYARGSQISHTGGKCITCPGVSP